MSILRHFPTPLAGLRRIYHDLQTARKKLAALDRGERESLMQICADIYGAQQALTEKAAPLLDQCMTRCQGLCCRNIRVAEIITKWDLIYILAMRPELGSRMASCLEKKICLRPIACSLKTAPALAFSAYERRNAVSSPFAG